MTYAQPQDVEDRYGRQLTPEMRTLVTRRLEDVERMILRRVPDLEERIAGGVVDPADVAQIECEAVLRLVRNPFGYFSETDGDYTYQFMQNASSGTLELLSEEWAVLGVKTGGVFLIAPRVRTPFEERSEPDFWFPL
ncbi:Gp19/Gp15/Gp42 family protein [Segniliparus rugosus]|uniref:Head-to-tail adaptor n=1 Tax=Segniliparus rugosus (strain ATCC BAA-974 / DSM 45345 / CCUG 50838 / CIP 108380 / JCM 13579 / CDC 945) TaxID=679197 RepID=E5XRT2_SEGRC|nr:Gp19/Gp15/Gp42 family protein [Segniliparus rugosus]EFV12947.1 hypothetical protein HMPREF9336_02204 [Segniliparus rugosus ATCC BAA-974]